MLVGWLMPAISRPRHVHLGARLTGLRPRLTQVASAEGCEALAVQPNKWYDVPGLSQVSYTNTGEKAIRPT